MKIIKLKSQNVKRLVAVEIAPGDRPVVRLTGKNGSGKTSVLDSIMYALQGEKVIPSQPIRKGEEKAAIELDLGDLVVQRRFTKKGSYLEVTAKDGAKYPSPQAILDKLVGDLAFDPLTFMRQRPTQQLEDLARITTLDVSKEKLVEIAGFDIALSRGGPLELLKFYENEIEVKRTDLARDAKALRASADTAWADAPPNPPKEVSVKGLLEDLRVRQAEQGKWDARKAKRKDMAGHVERVKRDRDTQERIVGDLARQLKESTERLEAFKRDVAVRVDQYDADMREDLGSRPVTDEIVQQISEAEGVNAKVAAHKKAVDLEAAAAAAADKTTGILDKLTALRAYKAEVQKAATFPVEGLSFGENEVLYNGLPLAQASDAEQLRVAVAIAMSANPKLRVIRIRDGSLLDKNGLALLGELATDKDFQVWIETVSEDKTVGVHIEDGQVVAVDGEAVDEARP